MDSLAGINKQRVILITYLIAALDISWLFLQFSITPVSYIVATLHCDSDCIYSNDAFCSAKKCITATVIVSSCCCTVPGQKTWFWHLVVWLSPNNGGDHSAHWWSHIWQVSHSLTLFSSKLLEADMSDWSPLNSQWFMTAACMDIIDTVPCVIIHWQAQLTLWPMWSHAQKCKLDYA